MAWEIRPERAPQRVFEPLIRERFENASAFLRARGVELGALDGIARGRVDNAAEVLLTSSAVHGYANENSDIDLVTIVDQEQTSGMAAQLAQGANHFEIVTIPRPRIATALRSLADVAKGRSVDQVGAAMEAWDSSQPVRRKYLERVVQGVTSSGEMPFAQHLPDLAHATKCAAMVRAAACQWHYALAMRAGWHRAAIGYAANHMIALIEATLCQRLDVCINRKWALVRADRLFNTVSATEGVEAVWFSGLKKLRTEVSGALQTSDPRLLSEVIVTLDAALGEYFGTGEKRIEWQLREGARLLPFLPGACLAIRRDAKTVLPCDPKDVPERLAGVESIASLNVHEARICAKLSMSAMATITFADVRATQ